MNNNILELTFRVERKIILNANVSRHKFDKSNRAKKLRALGQHIGQQYKDIKFSKFTIDIDIFPPTRRRFDPPNLSPSTKHIIDGLTDAGLWDDDDWTHLTKISFSYGGKTSGEKDIFIFKFIIKEVA